MSAENTNYLYNSLIQGDRKGILAIYKLVYPKVQSFVIRNSGAAEDAEDVFQKTLMQLAVRFRQRNTPFTGSFEAYLYTACLNQWRRILNSEKKWVTKQQDLESLHEYQEISISQTEEKEDEEEKWILYREMFELLSDNCKEVLRLLYKKLPYAKICEILGYSSEVVARQRVFKCRKKLSSLIQKDPRYKHIMAQR
ncbi:RNA polymerase sigma factor [Aureisphaera galaxeae]|uniref:RNA polymerase sigma factor n=1 Tax=Aureisphaera galaxeae TaxID=1538023 RepID=UPI002350E23D|nr:RNA polymerase sigma factor [Aureisphaera galaxeae]MDC8004681.1 RNA polymerase sigma factor [Aureisphaera galaxeae]